MSRIPANALIDGVDRHLHRPSSMLASISLSIILGLAPLDSAEPEAQKPGRAALAGSVATGVAGWGFAVGNMVCDSEHCRGLMPLLVGSRWALNGASLALAIPGGIDRGRHDALTEHRGGQPRLMRRGVVLAGAVTLAIGSAGWASARFWALDHLIEGEPIDPRIYFGVLQASWTLTTVGAGLISYVVARDRESRSLTRVRIAPVIGPDTAGLRLSGRF